VFIDKYRAVPISFNRLEWDLGPNQEEGGMIMGNWGGFIAESSLGAGPRVAGEPELSASTICCDQLLVEETCSR